MYPLFGTEDDILLSTSLNGKGRARPVDARVPRCEEHTSRHLPPESNYQRVKSSPKITANNTAYSAEPESV